MQLRNIINQGRHVYFETDKTSNNRHPEQDVCSRLMINNKLYYYFITFEMDMQSAINNYKSDSLWTEDHEKHIIKILEDKSCLKDRQYYYTKKNFMLVNFEGTKKVAKIKNQKIMATRRNVLSIINDMHTACGHRGEKKTYTKVSERYANIPISLINMFIQHCKICTEEAKNSLQSENTRWHNPHPIAKTKDSVNEYTIDIVENSPIDPFEIKVESEEINVESLEIEEKPLTNIDSQPTLSNMLKNSSASWNQATSSNMAKNVSIKRHWQKITPVGSKISQPRVRASEMEARARVERVQQLLKMDKELHEARLKHENEIHEQKMQNLKNRMMREDEIYRRKLLNLNLEIKEESHS